MPATQMKQRVAFRNILFATDFSSAANSALPYAASFARNFGAKLFAMHVKEPANYALPPELWQNVQEVCDSEMQQLRATLSRNFPELKPEFMEGEGSVWSALAAAVKEHEIDLIVVGTRGRTGIGKILLGSQAEEIFRRAPCPVLTVGPRAQSENERHGKLGSILFATDFGNASHAAAPIAVSLAEENQAQLTLLHVVEDGGANHLSHPAQFLESSERQLRALVPEEAKIWCAPHFLVEPGHAIERILEVAERTNADLIVLGVHKPEGVAGAATHLPIATVHHIVAHAKCPVLTVRG